MGEHKEAKGTQAIDRALAVLFAFTRAMPQRRLGDLAQELNLSRSTVHRLLGALVNAGLVRRDDRSEFYRLGAGNLELGTRFLLGLNLRTEARPFLEALVKQAGEPVTLAVLDGVDTVAVDHVASNNALQLVSRLGSRIPIYCTASGKALVLDRTDAELRDLLRGTAFVRYSSKTLADVAAFIREVDKCRKQGWAYNDEETEAGMRAVSAPIRDHTGGIVACVTLTAPTFRMQKSHMLACASAVTAAASSISIALGAGADWRNTPAPRG